MWKLHRGLVDPTGGIKRLPTKLATRIIGVLSPLYYSNVAAQGGELEFFQNIIIFFNKVYWLFSH